MPVTKKDEVRIPRTCSKCGRPGHQARTCLYQEATPIDKVGIEIEGYWTDLGAAQSKAIQLTGHRGCSDGSLSDGRSDYAPWEFQTKPGNLGESLHQLTSLYPDYTDDKAGMHVHLSFKEDLDVSTLATREFFAYFEQSMHEFGSKMAIRPGSQFWLRLEGRNQYCKKPGEQLSNYAARFSNGADTCHRTLFDGDRYVQVNFTSWHDHRTVEFRLLPMFQEAGLGVAAIAHLFTTVDKWITLHGRKLLDMEFTGIEPVSVEFVDVGVRELAFDIPTHDTEHSVEMFDLPDEGIGVNDSTFDLELAPEDVEPVQPGYMRTYLGFLQENTGMALVNRL